jgi:hypothetical protein
MVLILLIISDEWPNIITAGASCQKKFAAKYGVDQKFDMAGMSDVASAEKPK